MVYNILMKIKIREDAYECQPGPNSKILDAQLESQYLVESFKGILSLGSDKVVEKKVEDLIKRVIAHTLEQASDQLEEVMMPLPEPHSEEASTRYQIKLFATISQNKIKNLKNKK
jgi:hypothetical protein